MACMVNKFSLGNSNVYIEFSPFYLGEEALQYFLVLFTNFYERKLVGLKVLSSQCLEFNITITAY